MIGELALSALLYLSRIQVKDISVCVLNDSQAPVSEQTKDEVLSYIKEQYFDNLGVRFNYASEAAWDRWLIDFPAARSAYAETLCPGTDLQIIFSNKTYFKVNIEGDDPPYSNTGESDYVNGVVFLYRVDELMQKSDAGGNPLAKTVALHEIGHQFYEGHSSNKNSFMYGPSNDGKGQWTREVTMRMLMSKHRSWKDVAFVSPADFDPFELVSGGVVKAQCSNFGDEIFYCEKIWSDSSLTR